MQHLFFWQLYQLKNILTVVIGTDFPSTVSPHQNTCTVLFYVTKNFYISSSSLFPLVGFFRLVIPVQLCTTENAPQDKVMKQDCVFFCMLLHSNELIFIFFHGADVNLWKVDDWFIVWIMIFWTFFIVAMICSIIRLLVVLRNPQNELGFKKANKLIIFLLLSHCQSWWSLNAAKTML